MIAATPFRPPTSVRADAAAYREWLRALYRRQPRLFQSWARDARDRSYTLVGDEWETAVLYDALTRVARSLGIDIGEPLVWTEVQAARSDTSPPHANAVSAAGW